MSNIDDIKQKLIDIPELSHPNSKEILLLLESLNTLETILDDMPDSTITKEMQEVYQQVKIAKKGLENIVILSMPSIFPE